MRDLKFLHVGCGENRKDKTTRVFNSSKWSEVRFDIDVQCNPDILGSMVDMSIIDSESFDAVYSSHNIEHLFYHEAIIAIKEFYRVLNPDGYVFVLCPDLKAACSGVLERGPHETLYETLDGKSISPIDVLFGWRTAIQNGNEFMAHKYGYSEQTLVSAFEQCGFKKIASVSRKDFMDIALIAYKEDLSYSDDVKVNDENIIKVFKEHLQ